MFLSLHSAMVAKYRVTLYAIVVDNGITKLGVYYSVKKSEGKAQRATITIL